MFLTKKLFRSNAKVNKRQNLRITWRRISSFPHSNSRFATLTKKTSRKIFYRPIIAFYELCDIKHHLKFRKSTAFFKIIEKMY